MKVVAINPASTKLLEVSNVKPQQTNTKFSEMLADSLNKVNQLQLDSQQAAINLAVGKVEDISEVTIAAEKANIALQLTMQIRNKAVEAYQEVMRMQV